MEDDEIAKRSEELIQHSQELIEKSKAVINESETLKELAEQAKAKRQKSPPGQSGLTRTSEALKRGGLDRPSNIQWQTREVARTKDRWEGLASLGTLATCGIMNLVAYGEDSGVRYEQTETRKDPPAE